VTTTAGEVVGRAGALFGSLNELLAAAGELDLPARAADLGVAGTAAELTRQLVGVLEAIAPELQVLIGLGRLGALLGMIEPAMTGLRGLLQNSGRSLRELGLGQALDVTETIAKGFRYLETTAAMGASLVVEPRQLDALRDGLSEAIAALTALADDFEAAEESASA